MLQAAIASLALGCLALRPALAHADPPRVPVDVAQIGLEPSMPASAARALLPPAPDGYVESRVGQVDWTYPRAAESETRKLQDLVPEAWARLTSELGARVDGHLFVRVARNPDDMARLAPQGAAPPAYATGVTYPALGLIIVTLTAPESWERPDVSAVLTHELSHAALHRTVAGHPLPLWLVEGLAIHQASERSLDRIRALWEGTVRGQLVPLERLSRAFPLRPHAVNLAYAQSADIVGYLLGTDDDAERMRLVLRRVRRGEVFEDAVHAEYHVSLGFLEREWRERLQERYTATPLLLSGGGLWVLAAGLVIVGYVRRRKRGRETMRRWAEEEDEEIRTTTRQDPTQPMLPPTATLAVLVASADASEPDGAIPKIVVDGESHTVH